MSASNQELMDSKLWTVGDVAEYLQASQSWVYKKATAGELPVRRMGAMLRFVPSQIRDYALGTLPPVPVESARDRLRRAR